jgi:hypothetical protein
MLDLQPLAGLRDQVQAPSYDALSDTAGRRDRRAAVLAAAGSAAVVLAVVAGALMATRGNPDSSPGPVITPSPSPSASPTPSPSHRSATSMTPREVVEADGARLVLTAVSADDPDFRISFWEAACMWCPREHDSRFPHPTFTGMAITGDGFATATYRHTTFAEFEEGGLRPLEAVSPGPGLLLLVDGSNGGEWLVRDDGTVTRQARSSDASPTGDPRSWFVCMTNFDNPPGVQPDTPSNSWCKLDAAANTVHVMGSTWWGMDEIGHDTVSVVSPASGSPRWGLRNQSFDRLVGWWDADGTRHAKDFGAAKASGTVANAPVGTMAYWAWQKGSPRLTLFLSSDQGTSWQKSTVPVPFRPISPYTFDLSWTPDGALIARQEDAFELTDGSGSTVFGIRLWRSPTPEGGAFTKVHEGNSDSPAEGFSAPAFAVVDGRIWSKGLWSDDDGTTWNAIPRWR